MKSEFLILELILFVGIMDLANSQTTIGPPAGDDEVMNCREFSRHARFNPYSVLDDVWVVFYYWSSVMPQKIYKFAVPSAKNRQILQKYLNNSRLSYPINWTNPLLVMTEKLSERSHLLVQMGHRGEFLCYPIIPFKLKKPVIIYPVDLNFKQLDNGKYLAIIECAQGETFMLARPRDVPKKRMIQDVAAKLGFRGPGGKSYLYQGHSWMPIPEDDDYEPEMFYSYRYKHLTPDDPRWDKHCTDKPDNPQLTDERRKVEETQSNEDDSTPTV